MPEDKTKSIDDKLTTIEIKSPAMSWKGLHEAALSAIRNATGFKGNFSKNSDVNKYFSTYRLEPLLKDDKIMGILAVYAVNESKPKEKKRLLATGCSPHKSDYKF